MTNSDRGHSGKPVAAFYVRGEPALCYLFDEIAKRRPLRGFWFANAMDFVRLASGDERYDPLAPTRLPFLPGLGHRAIHVYGNMFGIDKDATVILTKPAQAALLPYFKQARKIYYAMDHFGAYHPQKNDLENTILEQAERIVVISRMHGEALCERRPDIAPRLVVSANAIPASWIPEQIPPTPLRSSFSFSKGLPVAGILGSASSRLRLDWLLEAVNRTPFLHWLFAGRIQEVGLELSERPLLESLTHHPRCTFTGELPYEDLLRYAQAIDIAVIPYNARSCNPYASPMRLYMQLPFGQPIIATPGCTMMEEFLPYVTMCRSADEMVTKLEQLHGGGFDDGLRHARWELAHQHSWARRADDLLDHLAL